MKDIPPYRRGCGVFDYLTAGSSIQKLIVGTPKLIYPEEAKAKGMSGAVFVWVKVDGTGKVLDAHVESGPPLLQEAALKVAFQTTFGPTKLDGKPIQYRRCNKTQLFSLDI